MDDDVLARAWPLGFAYGASFAQLYAAVENAYATAGNTSTCSPAAPCPRATAALRSSLVDSANADFHLDFKAWAAAQPVMLAPFSREWVEAQAHAVHKPVVGTFQSNGLIPVAPVQPLPPPLLPQPRREEEALAVSSPPPTTVAAPAAPFYSVPPPMA